MSSLLEVWKQIEGYEGIYDISNHGKVKSFKWGKERLLKIHNDTGGYPIVILHKNGIKTNKKVHRLVALAFIENTHNKKDINHKNGIKTDNFVENIEWATESENIKHAYDTGLIVKRKGTKLYNSKFTEDQILEIRSIKNKTLREIAEMYNVYYTTIHKILIRESWKHI